MKENNTLGKSFGPAGSFAGIIVFLGGLLLIISSPSGAILIIIGALLGFSYSSTVIDYERKRMKFSNNIFGLIKTGRWVEVNEMMKIGVITSNITWRSFSQSNRSNDLEQSNIMMILYGPDNKKIIPIKKIKKPENVEFEVETMSAIFGLKRIEF
jgi:hypothetical protein